MPTIRAAAVRGSDARICAATGEPIHVVEAESSVDALNKTGHYGTTWAGGAGATADQLAGVLAAVLDVRVVANHHESGIRCAHTILTAIPHATGWLSPRAGQDVRDVLTTAPTLAMLQPITEWRMTPHASS